MPTPDAREQVLRQAQERQVRFIELWFTDILGNLKSVAVPDSELETILESGKWFDGSSITGYAEAEESDILAMPDAATFTVLPWTNGGQATARMFCDVLQADLTPYPGDPRWVLKETLARAAALGFTFNVGPELEFFYFKDSTAASALDEKGYFDSSRIGKSSAVLVRTVEALQRVGIPVEAYHHEVAHSQHEIGLCYCDALRMADNVMTYRTVVKEVAQEGDLYATFMPKPIFGQAGSGMHVHQSLSRGGANAFFDPGDRWHLSPVAKQFIAGQLRHAREICALLAQWVNSYKRLVPGYEAPVYISWAQRNRTALIRVPLYRPGSDQATRAELRCPDPACNPYLAFAVMLAAGLEGIEHKYELPDPVEPNIYHMPADQREELGLEHLPFNLMEAVREAGQSDLVRRTLGEHVFVRFIRNKTAEWEQDRVQVTSHEIARYLPML